MGRTKLYTITFTDNEIRKVTAYDASIKDGILKLRTDPNNPNAFDQFYPLVNIFMWMVTSG